MPVSIAEAIQETQPVSIAAPVTVETAGDQPITLDGEDVTVVATETLPVQEQANSITYAAVAADNVVVKAAAGVLIGILVGEDVSGGTIEVSDSADDGDGAVKVFLKDPDVGYYPVNAAFATGICADIQGAQTKVSFIWR